MKRPLFGVIAAQIADTEQKQLLQGILIQAQSVSANIAIFSNIYNPNETNESLFGENDIYNLAISPDLDGILLLTETIVNEPLQQKILSVLRKRPHIPVVAVGAKLPNFSLPHFCFLNTDDVQDFEMLTEHLIAEHGFRNIDMLTGHIQVETSHRRAAGFRTAMQAHGLPVSEGQIQFGDFWFQSGNALAEQYIQGKRAMPEAVICANDYMAYGMLDTFLQHHISVPKEITIVGYEYIRERIYHAPLLTTFQRNRSALGKNAVSLLYQKFRDQSAPELLSMTGSLISGSSCSCGTVWKRLQTELLQIREEQKFQLLNLFSQLELCLTECCSMQEFLMTLKQFRYLIPHVQEITLCLREDWNQEQPQSKNMICYAILANEHPTKFHTASTQLSDFFPNGPCTAAYFSPLFFAKRTMGYVVLSYHGVFTYEPIFRNWAKTVSNGLEFLRMKTDIQYYIACQNISDTYDSVTGLYHETGFRSQIKQVLSANPDSTFTLGILKFDTFQNSFSSKRQEDAVHNAVTIAKLLQKLFPLAICGYFQNGKYGILQVDTTTQSADVMREQLFVFLSNQLGFPKYCETNAWFYADCVRTCADFSLMAVEKQLEAKICAQHQSTQERLQTPYGTKLLACRRELYQHPEQPVSTENAAAQLHFSIGYFRNLYRSFFGISYIQDCIAAKMNRAKYLLLSTSLHIEEIAVQCGYLDAKYFMRLFQKNAECTPSQYRKKFG